MLITLAQQEVPGVAQALRPIAPLLFFAFAALVALSGWAIVVSGNIVRMSVYLLFTLAGVTSLYFMLDAELLGAIQLIVYAGGTLILIVFGVMLTSKNPFIDLRVKSWETAVGLALAVGILGVLLLAMFHTELPATKPLADLTPVNYDQVHTVGRGLLSVYLVPFEVAGVLLLVVMIGAAFMARKRTK